MSLQDAQIGVVVAVGSEVDIAVKKGDKVIYSKYSTSDVSVPDGDVTFVAQKSVLATLS
jgi:chaperonin GroES